MELLVSLKKKRAEKLTQSGLVVLASNKFLVNRVNRASGDAIGGEQEED